MACMLSSCSRLSSNNQSYSSLGKQKGVCWVGGRQPVSKSDFDQLMKCGVTWISQTPFGWQSDLSSPVIEFQNDSEHMWWGESASGITRTTELAKAEGIEVLLKPHIWTRNGWPGDINMKSESDWKKWFQQYTKFIVNYANLAEQLHVKILCVGTELHFASKREGDWRALIDTVRQVYHGQLTYAANFNEEYEHIKFWDALDFIGIQSYFPLAQKEDAELADLIAAWDLHLKSIERTQASFSKPVIFTEIGYKSTNDTAIEPWRWPQKDDMDQASTAMQAKCYEAFFQTAWKREWLVGAYFWKWYPHNDSRMMEVDFSPQGKEAEHVMAKWFTKED